MLDKKIIADYLHDLANRIALGTANVTEFKIDGHSSQGTYRNVEIDWNEEKKNE
jgi:hypothetical protein